jgi:hypothetical protein
MNRDFRDRHGISARHAFLNASRGSIELLQDPPSTAIIMEPVMRRNVYQERHDQQSMKIRSVRQRVGEVLIAICSYCLHCKPWRLSSYLNYTEDAFPLVERYCVRLLTYQISTACVPS